MRRTVASRVCCSTAVNTSTTTPEIDYFAVSLPDFLVFDDDLQLRNEVHCRYMMALGHLGLGQREEAAEQFQQVRNAGREPSGSHCAPGDGGQHWR